MPQKRNLALIRSLEIIQAFADNGAPLKVKEIHQRVGLPESTLYRYITTLTERSFLEYDSLSQKYRLGINFIKLGYAAARQMEIHRSAISIMEELARETGEMALLSVRRGVNAILVEVVDSSRGMIKLAMNRGDILPLYSCALTRPLIAHLSNDEIESLLKASHPQRFTQYTIIDLQEIRNELLKIKRQGYAYSDQELTIGARGLGAPVFDYSGAVVAALCLAGPLHHFTRKNIPHFLEMLLQSTEQCSLKMGFNPQPRKQRALAQQQA